MLKHPAQCRVTSLVDRDAASLLGCSNLGSFLKTANDSVDSVHEIYFLHKFLSVAGSDKSRLVADISDVGTRESRRLTGEEVGIDRLVDLDRAQVYAEDLLAFVEVGQLYMDLAIETASAEERLVKDIGAVGSGQDNDATVGAETIHLGQQLVERVLALVVAVHARVTSAGTTHGVYLINKDDTRCFLFSLAEKIAYARSADAYEHLHEIGT